MNWKPLTKLDQLEILAEESKLKPLVIFKHSTTCSISVMAKRRLESNWNLDLDAYYLDLKQYKEISNTIAEKFSVHHESPQLILLKDGEVIYDASHFDISVEELQEAIV
jgi:bacillithiol system protein YtxJ